MIHYLLLYQFAFLYSVIIVLGLVVYGSDFDEAAGNLYFIPLFVLPLLHWLKAKLLKPLASVAIANTVLLVGAVVALLAYKQLHFAFWDEHSLPQAIALSLLGLLSYLASVIAAMRLSVWQGNHQQASAIAWLVLALTWLAAYYFPMIPLFVLAVILAVAGIWSATGVKDLMSLGSEKMPAARTVKYLVFVLLLDLGLVVWDYQVNTSWAWYLSGAMIAAALGSWLAFTSSGKYLQLIIIIAAINFVSAVIWPGFILHHVHSGVAGLCLGWSIAYLMNAAGVRKQYLPVVSAALWVFLGLAVGYGVYANLAYAQWRVVFLVPLLILLILLNRKSTSALTLTN